METKEESISLWKLMYGPWPKRPPRQSGVTGPLFDFTVIALGILGAISYLVSNHAG
jgi:hypothetical protein